MLLFNIISLAWHFIFLDLEYEKGLQIMLYCISFCFVILIQFYVPFKIISSYEKGQSVGGVKSGEP